jgi:spore germination cell wall hydrolase CwlJ-like protein
MGQMRTTRKRPKRARASIGFAIAILALAAMGATYQSLALLVAGQEDRSDATRRQLNQPLFDRVHAATFAFPHPIGSEIPDPKNYELANLDAREADITGSIADHTETWDTAAYPNLPTVNRTLKGDRLDSGPTLRGDKLVQVLPKGDRLVPAHPAPLASKPEPGPGTPRDEPRETASVTRGQAPAAGPSPETPAQQPTESANAQPYSVVPPETEKSETEWLVPATIHTARLYFGVETDGDHPLLEPWAPMDEPARAAPDANGHETGAAPGHETSDGGAKSNPSPIGESIAPKGQVTGAEQRPKSPAEMLGLTGKAREKAEKCLANAVYFEARAEPVRGQIAVAQVVMNRVFSGYYPSDVCGVVYQNANRHLGCQFTFACDGIPDVVNEPDAWVRARQIARDTLDGKLWLPEIGKATHYHAYWVRPSWVHEMIKLNKIGVHTFYRPLNWGDGADAPTWGDAATTAEEAKKL